jgi:hypothetical protein
MIYNHVIVLPSPVGRLKPTGFSGGEEPLKYFDAGTTGARGDKIQPPP